MTGVLKSFVYSDFFESALKELFNKNIQSFKTDVQDIFFQDKVLDARSDLQMLWKRIPSRFYSGDSQKWNKQWGKIIDQIHLSYFASRFDMFYNDCTLEVQVKSFDKATSKVIVDEIVRFSIVPIKNSSEATYKTSFKSEVYDDQQTQSGSKIISIDLGDGPLDKEQIDSCLTQSDETSPDGKRRRLSTFKKVLTGKTIYQCTRVTEKSFYLNRDPSATFCMNTFSRNLTVRCTKGHPDLLVDFAKLGTFGEFTDTGGCKVQSGKKGLGEVKFSDLVFPGQGCIIIYVQV